MFSVAANVLSLTLTLPKPLRGPIQVWPPNFVAMPAERGWAELQVAVVEAEAQLVLALVEVETRLVLVVVEVETQLVLAVVEVALAVVVLTQPRY